MLMGAATDIDGGENMEGAGDMDTVSFEKLVDVEDLTFSLVTNATDVENVIGTDEDDMLTGDAMSNEIEGRRRRRYTYWR